MKETAISDVSYWTSNIQNIKKNPPTDLNVISEVTREQMGTNKVYITFYFINPYPANVENMVSS